MSKINTLSTSPFDPNSFMNYNQAIGRNNKATRKNDRQQLINLLADQHMIETLERFRYEGLPSELPQDIIERILYFRGKGAAFKHNDTHFFLPFTLQGTIDPYGRYATISPMNWSGTFNKDGKSNDTFYLPPGITGHEFTVVYDKEKLPSNPAVILTDRSLSISQDIVPHAYKVQVLLERLVNTLIMIETNNINGVQTYSLFVEDQAQKDAVELEFQNFDDRILEGKRVQVIVASTAGTKPFHELTNAKNITDSQRYWQSFSSWNNLRKTIIGVANAGQHLKMEHSTDAETELSSEGASAIMNNALRMRQEFCDLFNAVWGTNIKVFENNVKEEETITAPNGAQTKQIEGDDE